MQTWVVLAIAAASLSALERVTHRLNLAGEADTRDYALTFQAACTLLCLPLLAVAWPKLEWPPLIGIAAMIAAAICWAIFSVLTFKADSLLEASVKSGVSRLRLIWTFLLGVIVFSEAMTPLKVVGALVVAGAPLVLVTRNREISRQGVAFEAASTLAVAGALTLDKICLRFLPGEAVTFFSFANAAIFTFALRRTAAPIANRWMVGRRLACVSVAALLSVACYLALMMALASGELSRVTPIYMLAPLIATVLAVALLRERSDAGVKIAVAIAAAIGGCLTTL